MGLVHPRSGLAARHGITVVNAPGTVDSGYRGEVLVNLVNLDPSEPFTVRVGDRIAQLVVQSYLHADFDVTDSLPGYRPGGDWARVHRRVRPGRPPLTHAADQTRPRTTPT